MMKKAILRKYAELIVKVGANVQKGQGCVVFCSVEQSDFAALVVKEAYKAGAKWVHVEWSCEDTTRLKYKNESAAQLSQVAKWEEDKQQFLVENLPAMIHILSADPDGLKGISPEKMQKSMVARSRVLKKYRDAMDNKYQWTIAAIPGAKWAKKVFPQLRTGAAVEKLWQEILKTVRVDENSDPAQNWSRHNAMLLEKCEKLNTLRFERLHYYSTNGTDFTCSLLPNSLWLGGGEALQNGVYYNPNMPTEEVFTTPKKGACSGTLVATMPLSYQGNLIENFSITYEDGKAVACKAEKGQELLEKLLHMDEGAAMLGELALVDGSSPIAQSGILYYNTLFDENASCHVAIGRGYSNTIENYAQYTGEELTEMGVNDSMVHVDFMVGCDTLQIDGVTSAGDTVPVMRDGRFVI